MIITRTILLLLLSSSVIAAPPVHARHGVVEHAHLIDRSPRRGGSYSWSGGNRQNSQSNAGNDAAITGSDEDSNSGSQSQPQSQGKGGQGGSSGSSGSSGSGGGGGGGGGGYIGIVNKYRGTMGLASLTQDTKLQSNAQDTSQSSGGQLKHKLNSGSMAQVMAPGNEGNFESVFVGGWLCERPSLPGLSSICPSMSKGWNHAGQTGHADILSDKKYKKIGCGLASGIWTCDLA